MAQAAEQPGNTTISEFDEIVERDPNAVYFEVPFNKTPQPRVRPGGLAPK